MLCTYISLSSTSLTDGPSAHFILRSRYEEILRGRRGVRVVDGSRPAGRGSRGAACPHAEGGRGGTIEGAFSFQRRTGEDQRTGRTMGRNHVPRGQWWPDRRRHL